jgi:hypothetical protein
VNPSPDPPRRHYRGVPRDSRCRPVARPSGEGYFGLIDEVADKIVENPQFLDALQERNADNSIEEAKRLHVRWREMDQSVTWPIMSNPLSLSLRGMLVYYEG